MKIGIIIAMEEEALALDFLNMQESCGNAHKTYTAKYGMLDIVVMISKIGKAASAATTSYLINKYSVDFLLNLGSCGGLNNSAVGDIILSNTSGYCDVDVRVFGYKLGQMPQQAEFFKSCDTNNIFADLCKYLQTNKYSIRQGFIITADSFISDSGIIKQIRDIYPNTLGVDMEGAAFAQTCNTYGKNFLLLKKVSDMADEDASKSFNKQINKMAENTSTVLRCIFDYYNINHHRII